MKKLLISLLFVLLLIGNLSAQFESRSLINNNLDSTRIDTEARLDRPRYDGDGHVGKASLFVVNGIVVSPKEGNPLSYLLPDDVESIRVFKFANDEQYYGIVFVKTKKGVNLRKKLRRLMKNVRNAEYVIFGE